MNRNTKNKQNAIKIYRSQNARIKANYRDNNDCWD